MAFCNQCGAKVEDGSKFCTACGAPVDQGSTPVQASDSSQKQQKGSNASSFEKFIAYTDTTANYRAEDITANRYVSILAYLHILVLIPLLAMKESPFTQYHAKVGLNLLLLHLAAEVAGSIVTSLVGWIPVIGWIVGVAIGLLNFVLWCVNIFGIVSAVQGKARELTVLESFKVIK